MMSILFCYYVIRTMSDTIRRLFYTIKHDTHQVRISKRRLGDYEVTVRTCEVFESANFGTGDGQNHKRKAQTKANKKARGGKRNRFEI